MHHAVSHTFTNNNTFESGSVFLLLLLLLLYVPFSFLRNVSFPTLPGISPSCFNSSTDQRVNVQHAFYKRTGSVPHTAVYGCVILLTPNDVVTTRGACSYQERAAASILPPATFRALLKNNAKNIACRNTLSNCVCKHGHINPRPCATKSS